MLLLLFAPSFRPFLLLLWTVPPKSGPDHVFFCLMARPDLCRVFSEPGPQNESNKLYTLLHQTDHEGSTFFHLSSSISWSWVAAKTRFDDVPSFGWCSEVAEFHLPPWPPWSACRSGPGHHINDIKKSKFIIFYLFYREAHIWRGVDTGEELAGLGVIIKKKSFWDDNFKKLFIFTNFFLIFWNLLELNQLIV